MNFGKFLERLRRKRPAASDPQRTAESLRQLYFIHQKQKRHWIYIIMSSLMLVCLFIVMSLFTTPNLWVIAIPFTVILYSYFQIRRCSRLARMIRQALAVQSQIDKAQKEAEERDKAEAEAKAAAEAEKAEEAERVKPVIEALSERDVADPGGANGSGSRPPDPPDTPEPEAGDDSP